MQYPTAVTEDQRPFSGGSGNLPSSLGASVKAGDVGKVQQELLQVELDAAKVRGLQPNIDVPEHFVTQAEMRSILVDQLQKSYPREQARLDELEYWLLRFTNSPGINLFQMQADLLSEQVVGLYDPGKKELFVLGGQAQLDPAARTTLAHEYVHSLQDQHYDLRRLMPPDSRDTDKMMGAQAVVEGDATLSQLLYADQFLTADEFRNLVKTSAGYMDQNQLNSVPDVFRERLLFPYTHGLDFVKSLYARGGFETVNQALKEPPVSTEQILHPEKYLAANRDDPKPVGVPPLTHPGRGLGLPRYTDDRRIRAWPPAAREPHTEWG